MAFGDEPTGRYIRIIAIISLLLGLSDAARLLGVWLGDQSPLALLGPSGFTWLAIFCIARLFAAVGLWIKASWGAVLLLIATTAELTLFLAGSPDAQMSLFGFGIRLVLLVAILLIFALTFALNRRAVQD